MKHAILAFGLLVCAAQVATAATTPEGDAGAGKEKAAPCAACHAEDGNSAVPSFPKLAGLGDKYLFEQLQYIRDGVRPVAQMAGQLDGMSDQDLADLAAYYDSKTRSGSTADPDLVELGEQVYRAGIPERNVAACIACHSPSGSGNAPAGFPALGGQHAEYIAQQLEMYRKGYEDPEGRVTDGDIRIMRSNAFGLSDMEIEAVSSYAAGLR